MTSEPDIISPAPVNRECVDLLDAVFDLATAGKVQSVAIVMVTAPGIFRIAAAGNDIDGMLAGATKMQSELFAVIEQTAKTKPAKPALTILHTLKT